MGRKRRGIPIHGWLNIDKDAGLSSAAVVGAVRRITKAQKAGHAGTLDPFATGVLPIALGEATKTVPYLVADEKEYGFTARFGEATNTDDIEGEICETSDHRPSDSDIEAILPKFTGVITQIPPAYSAIKINGQRAYKLAREGEEVEMPERQVTIHDLRFEERVDETHARFYVRCSKGTYIRALARDIAIALGTVAHLTQLRRLSVGPFSEKSAISLDKLEQLWQCPADFEDLLPLTTALDDIPAVAISETQAIRVRHGNDVAVSNHADGMVCAMDGEVPLAICKVENGIAFPVRVFNI
ncbi:tRNA pseudouridine(55) synthase TruB [Sneathiella sp. P13V-1]|uniref:tRNA pseudouridine(55) synthase TruB n=1 Tax=Sneathiella sp. P13V-1 TaxID=2697366 RepID=UPI00187B54ED|nr:tRNA pseudouridine(55) synthase TruB [Sneathiella sp. P13V-1]MBE7635866.1 tRNA pseudouridine(55) synthase TruB [Sneathiella sp. P13V-1]